MNPEFNQSNAPNVTKPAALRRRKLEERILRDGFVSVSETAQYFDVSAMTIRRDLEVLEKQGVVERSFGGAVRVSQTVATPAHHEERPFARRASERQNEKMAIAHAAAEHIFPNESIGLDVGTTVCELAKLLFPFRGLNIITSSLRTVMALAEAEPANCTVHLLGGRARLDEGALCGPVTIAQLANYSLDRVFLGAAGLTAAGVYDFSVEDSEVKKAYIRSANEVVLLCDSTKFGKRSLYQFTDIDSLSLIITDAPPPPEMHEALEKKGVHVQVAGRAQ